MTEKTRLHTWRHERLALADVLSAWRSDLEGAAAVAYTPSACRVLLVKSGCMVDENGGACDASPYEVRAFNARGELRWRCDPAVEGRQGPAAYLTEDPNAAPSEPANGWKPAQPCECLRLDTQYALWGNPVGTAGSGQDWTRLADPRIGSLTVPLSPVRNNERIRLITCEYLARETGKAGDDGNIGVVDERLVRLDRFVPETLPAKGGRP